MLFLILVTARILGELFAKMGIPSVLGELSAGILLGVSGFGIIEVNEVLKILAEIGIILLLFEVGLETDVKRLKEAGSKAIGTGIGATCSFHDMKITKTKKNAPQLKYKKKIRKKFNIKETSVSVTHDGGFAIAVVVNK